MSKQINSLHPEFRNLINLHGEWPREKDLKAFLRSPNAKTISFGIKSGVYGSMKAGNAVPIRQLIGLSAYFLYCLEANALERKTELEPSFCEAFSKFLLQHGVSNPKGLSAQEITAHILAPDEVDYVAAEADGWHSLYTKQFDLSKLVTQCKSPEEVCNAVRWMYIQGGRSLRIDSSSLRVDDAIAAAAKHFDISLEDFQQKAISWWTFNRWTVVLAPGKRGAVAMSIVLPLCEEAYNSMRSGQRMGFDVSTDDLVFPSRFLMIAGTAECPVEFCLEEGNLTKYTINAILAQYGVLTYGDATFGQTIHSLTFTGCPLSRQRLIRARYKPLGVKMPRGKMEFYEKRLSWIPRRAMDFILRMYLDGLGRRGSQMLRPPIKDE